MMDFSSGFSVFTSVPERGDGEERSYYLLNFRWSDMKNHLFVTILDISACNVLWLIITQNHLNFLTLRVQEFGEAQVLLSDVEGLLEVMGCIGPR